MLAFKSAVIVGVAVIALSSLPLHAQVAPESPPPVGPVAPTAVPPPASPAQPETPPVAKTTPKPVPKAVKKGPVDSLRPGQFVWESRAAYQNPLRLVVVLDIQRMYVFDGDELVGFTTVSSGKKGKETPTGVYKILQKKEYHESNIYANAPMPFMQRLTWDGIALHAGHLPGYPASHGCVRLPKSFAKALYGATQMEGEVVILASLAKPEPKPPVVTPPPSTQLPVTPPPVVTDPVEPQPVPPPPSAPQTNS
jgi:lipoprotein-anchoring transpeptidase ErfK/SrfK